MSEENQGTKKMVEIILAAVIGIGLGIGGTVIVINQPQQDQTDEVAEAQQEVIKQLTDLDLIKEICAPEQTKSKEGFLLCREMTCFVYSRGIDSHLREAMRRNQQYIEHDQHDRILQRTYGLWIDML